MEPAINGKELISRMSANENLNLIDVREEIEFHTYNIGGKNIPLSRFNNNIDQITYNKTDEIIVICKIGLRSETAREILTEKGYLHVRNLAGGLLAIQKLRK
ncbi:adenylyltransferase/sulfurtransferase [Mucilaginibacter frigoritolerans]|jgi:rhodanese-related sulfurtransferase|uniref:Adenylyltransferase/sulfurtransferase n=1 Tax=Mucilaginibacter frigoritolerans TaxID=652788 RepID=A0A562TY50_9SPHI|nr:rhodanese-like domain-containing protein [Mucilaginibacter frigoritolerans]TWI98024.1 adenylyltransferase/sulfurtransferase [Mucilaginibacter frigoritolerans]